MPHVPSIEQTFMSAASLATRSFRFERPKSGVLIRSRHEIQRFASLPSARNLRSAPRSTVRTRAPQKGLAPAWTIQPVETYDAGGLRGRRVGFVGAP